MVGKLIFPELIRWERWEFRKALIMQTCVAFCHKRGQGIAYAFPFGQSDY